MKKFPALILAVMAAVPMQCAMPQSACAHVRRRSASRAQGERRAAMTGNGVDAWMSFYASNAVGLLPNDQIASNRRFFVAA